MSVWLVESFGVYVGYTDMHLCVGWMVMMKKKNTAQLELALKTGKLDQEICSRSQSSEIVLPVKINTLFGRRFFY